MAASARQSTDRQVQSQFGIYIAHINLICELLISILLPINSIAYSRSCHNNQTKAINAITPAIGV